MNNWKFNSYIEPFDRDASFNLWKETSNGDVDCVETFIMKRVPAGEIGPQTPRLPKQAFQAILDGLWNAGFRPEGYQDPRENMATMTRHLEDMRAITFSKLNVPKP